MINRRDAMKMLATASLVSGFSNAVFAKDPQPQEEPDHTTHRQVAGDQLKVLTLNVWNDCRGDRLEQTANIIKKSQADLVGLQEVTDSGPELEKLTGLKFIRQERGGILSRFPVEQLTDGGLGARIRIRPDQCVWIFNVHLYHEPYQPYQLAEIPYAPNNPFISTATEAIAEAMRARGGDVTKLLFDLRHPLQNAEMKTEPIFVTGDFNEPSHLDWTDRAYQAGLHSIAVEWPHSRALESIGFADSFRAIHPDEVTHPGYTWTPVPSEKEVMDRIDFVYHKNIKPLKSEIIGEAEATSDLVVTPYPSDHRAVVSTYELP